MYRRTITFAALAAGSLLFSACGDDDAATDMPGMEDHDHDDDDGMAVADGAREVEVTAQDLAFDPEEITAEVGEDLAIVLTSEDMRHDFTIEELDVHVAADRGDTAEGGLRADEAGSYTYYCSVPGHRQAGMEGTLTVE
jgi:plastocyanin